MSASFEILKFSENKKSSGLDQVRSENALTQTILDKGLYTVSQN